jgi:uncharacterized membrane protein YphA (DoxX/SURF4 family)
MAKNFISSLCSRFSKTPAFMEKYLAPLLLLAMRLWIANIFYKSGMVKFSNMDNAVALFESEYNLPYIPPLIAAYSSVFFEIVCSALLAVGLLTRLATLPLIAIVLVIQFFVFQNNDNFYWLFLLSTILIYGGGKISLDNFVKIK